MSGGMLRLANTIVAQNTNAGAPDCGDTGTVTSAGYDLIGNSTGCTFVAGTGDQVGSGAAPIDPLLGPLGANGGLTATVPLASGSPAIDTGNPAVPGSGGDACAATDQRGAPRALCDIGAYELLPCKGQAATLWATPGVPLVGSVAGEVIFGSPANDSIKSGAGNDTVCAGAGKDKVSGQAGKDKLLGEDGRDKLKGGGGKDKLVGGRGKDKLNCGGGKDKGTGGPGRDSSSGCEKGRA